MSERTRGPRHIIALVVLLLPACAVCVLWPPLIAYQPQPTLALALVAIGAALVALPKRGRLRWLDAVGLLIVWCTAAWCVLSQVAPLDQSPPPLWSRRAFPVVVAAALWLWLRFPRAWQRRTTLALALPSLLGLPLVAFAGPSHPLNFPAYYVAADSTGTLYVTDEHSPVIRVFAPGGGIKAKLRPGLASRVGPPGPGFSPPGAFNDPEGLGILGTPTPTAGGPGVTSRDPLGDEFHFCGLALDARDRLYVPDLVRGNMLRFLPDGHLDSAWPLPPGVRPARNCVAVGGDMVYFASQFGDVWRYDAGGHLLWSKRLGESVLAGLTAAPDGATVYFMTLKRLYVLDPRSDGVQSEPLPAGQAIYTAILGRPRGRLMVADPVHAAVNEYCGERRCGQLGNKGALPGQFALPNALAQDTRGNVYVVDATYHLVQRFDASGHVDAVYWGPNDDETE